MVDDRYFSTCMADNGEAAFDYAEAAAGSRGEKPKMK